MPYISAVPMHKSSLVRVWERIDKDTRIVKDYPAPYYFFAKDPDGEYNSIYGDRLSKHVYKTLNQCNRAIEEFKYDGIELFESDIGAELRVLSERYYGGKVPKLNITFYDIEVDYNPRLGFSSPSNPYAPINSVALYHEYLDEYVVLAVPPEGYSYKPGKPPQSFIDEMDDREPLPDNLRVLFCRNERDLLIEFLKEIRNSDVLSGWNSDFFDAPYIAERLKLQKGNTMYRQLSFPETVRPPRVIEVDVFGRTQLKLELYDRVSVDYMELFKKYEMAIRGSYKLETIAEEVLPDMRKLEFEGSLAELYNNNFPEFVRYNIRDTEVLHGFEKKLGYVELANQMCHLSTGMFKHVTGTLKLAELALNNFCHYELDQRVPNINVPDDGGSKIKGAIVLDPKIGMHEWVSAIDIASLYPSAIRSVNISPEKLIGQFVGQEADHDEILSDSKEPITLDVENSDPITKPSDEWRDWLLSHSYSVSGYGTVFDQGNGQGIIPAILTLWFDRRKHYKRLMEAALDDMEALDNHFKSFDKMPKGIQETYLELKQEASFNDRLQYVYKIKLNSLYGATSNKHFRYFDKRLAESTTATGRKILMHQVREVAELLDGERDHTAPSIIYSDTDSVYFKTHQHDRESAILVGDTVTAGVNASFQPFMKNTFLCTSEYDNLISAEREIISDRGIFVEKKRYILHLVDKDGYAVDKMKIMGLELKKTTLPKPVQIALTEFIGRLLGGEDWHTLSRDIVTFRGELRKKLHTDIQAIGLPKGVNKVEYYRREFDNDYKTFLPGHVAAAICWNIQRALNKDTESLEFSTGMKLKVYYLKAPIGRFKSIAIPTDQATLPSWFMEDFIERIDVNAQLLRLVDKPLANILKAIGKRSPSAQSILHEELMTAVEI